MVVDPPGRNAAMAERWRLPYPIVADPDGETILRPLGLWNPDERGGIAWPGLVVFDAEGTETWRFRSRDFADRPPDVADLLTAVASLNLGPMDPPPVWVPDEPAVADRGAFTAEAFVPFFSGIRTSALGLAGRLETAHDRSEAGNLSAMAKSFLDAWKERRQMGR